MRDLKIIFIFNNDSFTKKSEIEKIINASFSKTCKINYNEKSEINLSNKSISLNVSKANAINKIKLNYEFVEKSENKNLFGDDFLMRNFNNILIINNKIYTKDKLIFRAKSIF